MLADVWEGALIVASIVPYWLQQVSL